MARETDSRDTNYRMSRTRLGGAGIRNGGAGNVFGDIAREYAFGRVAASSRKPYQENWRMRVSWRSFVGKASWLQKDMGEIELVREWVEFVGYC